MIQNIIAIIIIWLAIGYAIYSLVKSLRERKAQNTCGGCSACTTIKEKK